MRTTKILSIDFDYFIDTDLATRNEIFPNGADEMPKEELMKKWNDVYVEYPHVKDIGVIKDYEYIYELLSDPKFIMGKNVFVSSTHKDMYKFLVMQDFTGNDDFKVYNIDFHHDMYHYRVPNGDRVNCSNWARMMLEDFPKSQYKWIRREDSETQTLFGEIECEHTTSLEDLNDIDYVFICESPEWTPPHLHWDYLNLIHQTIK